MTKNLYQPARKIIVSVGTLNNCVEWYSPFGPWHPSFRLTIVDWFKRQSLVDKLDNWIVSIRVHLFVCVCCVSVECVATINYSVVSIFRLN